MVHMIGHSVGAWTHAPHGYALASVSMAYYRRAMENGLPKMLEIGLPLTISELGATNEMIPGITETTVVYPAGYLDLTKEDITEILMESM